MHMDHPVSVTDRELRLAEASRDARELLGLGRRLTWDVQPLGRGPLLRQSVFVGGWWLVPVAEDKTRIPRRALERVTAIYAAGLRPKGFIVAHEAPAALRSPTEGHRLGQSPQEVFDQLKQTLSRLVVVDWVRGFSLEALRTWADVLLMAAKGILIFSGTVLSLALVDPILIAVTEDDYWVEIDRWQT
jgi:hypothetical protein